MSRRGRGPAVRPARRARAGPARSRPRRPRPTRRDRGGSTSCASSSRGPRSSARRSDGCVFPTALVAKIAEVRRGDAVLLPAGPRARIRRPRRAHRAPRGDSRRCATYLRRLAEVDGGVLLRLGRPGHVARRAARLVRVPIPGVGHVLARPRGRPAHGLARPGTPRQDRLPVLAPAPGGEPHAPQFRADAVSRRGRPRVRCALRGDAVDEGGLVSRWWPRRSSSGPSSPSCSSGTTCSGCRPTNCSGSCRARAATRPSSRMPTRSVQSDRVEVAFATIYPVDDDPEDPLRAGGRRPARRALTCRPEQRTRHSTPSSRQAPAPLASGVPALATACRVAYPRRCASPGHCLQWSESPLDERTTNRDPGTVCPARDAVLHLRRALRLEAARRPRRVDRRGLDRPPRARRPRPVPGVAPGRCARSSATWTRAPTS